MSNNKEHKLVNLSLLLLQQIIKYIDNIDRICFTLVCTRWFRLRDNYLFFDVYRPKAFNLTFKILISTIYLKSYTKQIDLKKDILYGAKKLLLYKSYDAPKTYENKNLTKINKDINIIRIGGDYQKSLKDIKELIEDSNVTVLEMSRSFFTSADCIPKNIKKIKFNTFYNDKFPDDIILPEGLESFNFGYKFNHPISQIKFPSTLVSLKLSYSFTLDFPKELPANLETLRATHFRNPEVLLQLTNLTSLSALPIELIEYIAPLKSLLTLTVRASGHTDEGQSLRKIPSSVRNLTIQLFDRCNLVRSVPSTIDSLHILSLEMNQPIDIYSLFYNARVDNDTDFDYVNDKSWFKLNKLTFESPLRRPFTLQESSIPEGVISLSFPTGGFQVLKQHILPSTLKELSLGQCGDMDILEPLAVPNGVEHLDLGFYQFPITSDIIPSSVTHLKCHYSALKGLECPSIVKSLSIECNHIALDNNSFTIKVRRLDNDKFLVFSNEILNGAIIQLDDLSSVRSVFISELDRILDK